jgi:anaerobic ribonucleoside-triphosphate reductase activating protein
MEVRLHAVEFASRANGPGLRAAVWFQGCTLGCPGCFNPDTHDVQSGYLTDTALLAEELLARRSRIEGVTISGGEPFQQPEALLDLLRRLDGSGLSCLVFSGYSRCDLQLLRLGQAILRYVDVLIAGRYVAARHLGHGLVGSTNQRIHLLTRRYTLRDFDAVPRCEVILHADGTISASGIQPWRAA